MEFAERRMGGLVGVSVEVQFLSSLPFLHTLQSNSDGGHSLVELSTDTEPLVLRQHYQSMGAELAVDAFHRLVDTRPKAHWSILTVWKGRARAENNIRQSR